MKKVAKKNREACENAYKQCEDMEMCNVMCHGAHLHPECKQHLACTLDRIYCDGNCEAHELRKKLHDKKILLESIGHALTEMNFAYRKTKEEIDEIENRIKSL